MKRFVLVDGNALLHRAFHATPPLTTSKGELVNAVYGFTNMLLRSWDDLKPDYMAIAWDKKAPTFRHQEYTQYKATRGPADETLSSQYDRVHEVVKALEVPEFGLNGYEADDLIGTLARLSVEQEPEIEVIILTGDRDIMQTINGQVKVLMPKKTLSDVGLYGIQEFIDRFGFQPIQMIEYKALAGDASDNIPGVPGIGDVSATKLIKQFGAIEEIYKPENVRSFPPPAVPLFPSPIPGREAMRSARLLRSHFLSLHPVPSGEAAVVIPQLYGVGDDGVAVFLHLLPDVHRSFVRHAGLCHLLVLRHNGIQLRSLLFVCRGLVLMAGNIRRKRPGCEAHDAATPAAGRSGASPSPPHSAPTAVALRTPLFNRQFPATFWTHFHVLSTCTFRL
jgi:5'-3' exonuclease